MTVLGSGWSVARTRMMSLQEEGAVEEKRKHHTWEKTLQFKIYVLKYVPC